MYRINQISSLNISVDLRHSLKGQNVLFILTEKAKLVVNRRKWRQNDENYRGMIPRGKQGTEGKPKSPLPPSSPWRSRGASWRELRVRKGPNVIENHTGFFGWGLIDAHGIMFLKQESEKSYSFFSLKNWDPRNTLSCEGNSNNYSSSC